jgi:uncharacterized membrane protein YdjX (TVP38/TMEM64 family)
MIVTLVTASFVLPMKDWLIKGLQWIQTIGPWGPVFVIVFYVAACVLFLPGSVITLGTGFIFKILAGSIIVSIGSTLGACAAFLVGRTIARNWIAEKMGDNPRFAAIDEAVGREGLKIVFLARLSPVFPFNLLNYAFGLTRISFWKYAFASWIGMMPGTVMYVYFGAGLRSLADAASGNIGGQNVKQVFFWCGMIATIVVTVFITRLARNSLKQVIEQTG